MKGIYIRHAFTMIELIFVIVILGILAAVALPKFAGLKGQSETAIVIGFAGTLNRTVGPMMWSTSISEGNNGSIKEDTNANEFNGEELPFYMDSFPQYLDVTTVDFDNCLDGTGSASPFIEKIGQGEYNIFCQNGTRSESPRFVADKSNTHTF